MPVDNSELIRPFIPATDDGDTFVYTEILDRTVKNGNNGTRLLRTFFHRSLTDYDRHLPAIRSICDQTGARAYIRLALRSFKTVGKLHAKLVMDAVVSENWAGMKTLYSSACGKAKPIGPLWLFDVDEVTEGSQDILRHLASTSLLQAVIPSRRGVHYITWPFDPRIIGNLPSGVSLMRSGQPTNLYIPDGFQEHNKEVVVTCSEKGQASIDVQPDYSED